MKFPYPIRPWALPLFLCLVVLGVCEAAVAVPSWNIIYPFIKDRLGALTSFFAASEQFASWIVCVGTLVVIWIHRPDLRRCVVPFLVAITLATVTTDTIKTVAGRARPEYGVRMSDEHATAIVGYLADHRNPVLKPVPGDYWLWFSEDRPGPNLLHLFAGHFTSKDWNLFGEYDSFPSGHATSAMVLAAFLALLFPQSRVLWYFLAVGCALSRIRFRRHYPADVIVGSAIGWYSVQLVFAWYWPFRLSDRLLGRWFPPRPDSAE